MERKLNVKNTSIGRLLKKWKTFRRLYHAIKFSITKGNMRRAWHFVTRGHIGRRLRISHFLRGGSVKKLQIGGGSYTKVGWLNGDLIAGDIYLNAAKEFSFPDSSLDLIFAEQFIEHLEFKEGQFFLRECFRVLKENGKIRLSTPDLERLFLLYRDRNPEVSLKVAMEHHKEQHNRALTTGCHFINDMFRLWGHSFIYDQKTLETSMRNVGFRNFSRWRFGFSDRADLSNLERHAHAEWRKNAYELILEAQKLI